MTRFNILSARSASLWLVTALLAGCGPGAPAPKIVSPTSRPISMITPIEFFTPDQKRLGQHLGWTVGAFQVNYSGPDTMLHERLEVWQDGKPLPHGGSSTARAGTGEVSIAVRDMPGSPGMLHVTQVMSTAGSSSSSSGGYQRPKSDGGWSTTTAKIQNATDLVPNQEVAVWAMIIHKSGHERHATGNPSILEQVKQADWALVLIVKVGPEK